jgi:hypothetical protein
LAVQTWVRLHIRPTCRQTFWVEMLVSQQPVLQASPAQQGWPWPPQPAQVPEARQVSPAAQGCPASMQRRGAPVSQQPAEQVLPAQQTSPAPPQVWQVPCRQAVPSAVQVLLLQQG